MCKAPFVSVGQPAKTRLDWLTSSEKSIPKQPQLSAKLLSSSRKAQSCWYQFFLYSTGMYSLMTLNLALSSEVGQQAGQNQISVVFVFTFRQLWAQVKTMFPSTRHPLLQIEELSSKCASILPVAQAGYSLSWFTGASQPQWPSIKVSIQEFLVMRGITSWGLNNLGVLPLEMRLVKRSWGIFLCASENILVILSPI